MGNALSPRPRPFRPPRSRRRAGAFTLIELLVVASIVAILIALLIPAIERARNTARNAQCMSNLRGVAQQMLNYEVDFERFPVHPIE